MLFKTEVISSNECEIIIIEKGANYIKAYAKLIKNDILDNDKRVSFYFRLSLDKMIVANWQASGFFDNLIPNKNYIIEAKTEYIGGYYD